LLDVVRSAVGEAETYTGINIGQMPKVSVAGAAVADVIHLLAELVDNATSFSPPTARVEVRGNVAGRGIVIEIEDQGLGIEPEQRDELNEMLKTPPDFSVMALSEEPRLGLFVVTQLAVRHGVRVTLTESPSYGGIRVIVLLPLDLITSTVPTLPEMEAQADRSGPRRETIPGQVEVIGSVLPSRRSNRMLSRAPAEPSQRRPAPVESPASRESVAPNRPAVPLERGFVPPLRTDPSTPRSGAPGSPSAAPGSPTSHYPAPGEGERQTAEIPVIRPQSAAPEPTSTAPADPGTEAPPDREPGPVRPGTGPAPNYPTARPAPSYPGTGPIPRSPSTGSIPRSPEVGAVPLRPDLGPATGSSSRPVGTEAGRDERPALPRRTRQTHLAPQLFRDGRSDAPPPTPSAGDESQQSAESARDRLAAFQRGTRRGRQDEPDLG
jgi:hypothetical protein